MPELTLKKPPRKVKVRCGEYRATCGEGPSEVEVVNGKLKPEKCPRCNQWFQVAEPCPGFPGA